MIIREVLCTEVKCECDVCVCGGGIGGIAAALAAARSGKKVVLAERMFMLGGLATAGLVTVYLPLCDGLGRQVSFGLAEELLKLSLSVYHDEKRGYSNWIASDDPTGRTEKTPRYEVNFNPQLFAVSAEQLLIAEGVKILYGTTAVQTLVGEGRLEAVIFENKSGRFAVKAGSFIDATGDADLAYLSDTPTETFRQGNVLAAWYYSNQEDGYDLHMLGFADIPDKDKDGADRVKVLAARRFSGLDGEEISEYMQMSHDSTMKDVVRQRKENPEYQPTTIATIPQLRMTRRVVGEYTLDDTEMHKYFEDSIGMVSDWKKRGPVYEVPFRTLYSAKMKNLLFAGRVTSVTDAMWDIMRVIPCCAITGEAAGIAAAMSNDMTSIDLSVLQAEIVRRGGRIHEDSETVG